MSRRQPPALPPSPAPRPQLEDHEPRRRPRRNDDDDYDDRDRGDRDRDDRDDRDEDDDDRPRRRRPRRVKGDWGTTVTGLKMMFVCLLVYAAAGLLGSLLFINQFQLIIGGGAMGGGAFAGQNPFEAMGGGRLAMSWTLSCVQFIVMLVGFIGACLCCSAPDPAAKRWALTSILLFAGGIACLCLLFVTLVAVGAAAAQQRGRGGADTGAAVVTCGFGFLMWALWVASYVIWMLFHARVGRVFGNDSLRAQSFWYLGTSIGLVLLDIGVYVAVVAHIAAAVRPAAAAGVMPSLTGVMIWIIMTILVVVGLTAWFSMIVRQTYVTIENSSGGRRSRDDDYYD
jgi:hypothetical protein